MKPPAAHRNDPWAGLRRWTSARIALGRAGGSLPTRPLLEFRWAHARAMDAVEQPFDASAFAAKCNGIGLHTVASDPVTYLQRPDLGRVLSEDSRQQLEAWAKNSPRCDLVIVICDGLSALAVNRQASPLLEELLPKLADWQLAPLLVVRHGRVALQDQIGSIVGATIALTLIGERPGLVSPDSLGAYLVYGPQPGNTDANRNCVSNIRPEGLKPVDAAAKLYYLLTESRRRQLSGVHLKDESALPSVVA
jgi:ethanolamine ammonia-lyase small subunit